MLNRGVSFGWLEGIGVGVVLLAWGIVLVVAVKTRELWGRCGLLLILIGGIMNIFDRLRYGGVRDNLNWGGVLYNNVWDYLIVAGLVVYGYSYFVRRRANRRH